MTGRVGNRCGALERERVEHANPVQDHHEAAVLPQAFEPRVERRAREVVARRVAIALELSFSRAQRGREIPLAGRIGDDGSAIVDLAEGWRSGYGRATTPESRWRTTPPPAMRMLNGKIGSVPLCATIPLRPSNFGSPRRSTGAPNRTWSGIAFRRRRPIARTRRLPASPRGELPACGTG